MNSLIAPIGIAQWMNFSTVTSEDVCCYVRNVKFLKSLFLQHALFHHVCYRSFCFIFTEV